VRSRKYTDKAGWAGKDGVGRGGVGKGYVGTIKDGGGVEEGIGKGGGGTGGRRISVRSGIGMIGRK